MDGYSYSPATGEYIETISLRESPLEEGVHLVPAHCTTTAPPEAQTGFAACWNGAAWVLVEDHRGEALWDETGQTVIITDIGPLPEGLSNDQPVPDPYAVEPEYLDLGQVSIGHAERLYAAAQAEAANTDAEGRPGDGPATVLLEMLGL